ncbi:MAG: hypothetical protein ACRC1H_00100 [Caldilineaceae bacterium]
MARWISNVAAPPVLALVAATLLALRSTDARGWGWAAAFGGAAVVLPTAYILVQVQRGVISDIHVPLREQRVRPFIVSLACAAAICGIFLWWHAPEGFRTLAVANLVQAAVLFAITLRWKVSMHSAAAGSLSTMGLMVLGVSALSTLGVVLMASVPVVAWARIRLDRHTPAQTVVGAILGCVVTMMAIWMVV